MGYGLYFSPERSIGDIYTDLDASKIKKMWNKDQVDDVIRRRGGNPNPTLYKTEINISPDQIYVARAYDNQTPVVQSKMDAIIDDFNLRPIDKSKTRGWKDVMDNLEEVGKVPEEVFSNYGIKALKRDTTYSTVKSKNVGDIYYSVFDDSIIDIVDKTPITAGKNVASNKNNPFLDMTREARDSYIKSRKGPTEIPTITMDHRTLEQMGLDFDKAFLRGEFIRAEQGGSNPAFNQYGNVQFTGETFPDQYAYGDYKKYLDNPKLISELKLRVGPDLRYSTEIDPSLLEVIE
tara:strand:+ start:137 stop:1009 length:873 start_codon:yes stop_codon:yes gene_type:complete